MDKFVEAYSVYYKTALKEIKEGKKKTHWMWFIFPQLRGLGTSENSLKYGLTGESEARAFLKVPYLRRRFLKICKELIKVKHRSAKQIFGDIDEMKLHSSMSLFYIASENKLFKKVLDKYCHGMLDMLTCKMLQNNIQ